MRATFCTEKFGKFTFNIELDTGGAPGEEIVVWVHDKNGSVAQGERQFRAYFPYKDAQDQDADAAGGVVIDGDKFDESYDPVEKYCRQFARDKTFREAELTRWYGEAAQ